MDLGPVMIGYAHGRMVAMILLPLIVANVLAWTLIAGRPLIGLAWAFVLICASAFTRRPS